MPRRSGARKRQWEATRRADEREAFREEVSKRTAVGSQVVAPEGSYIPGDCEDINEVIAPFDGRIRTMVDRYYARLYKPDVPDEVEDHYAHIHSNRLCVIGISPLHALVTKGYVIEKVDFDVNKNGKDLRHNKVSGKKKHGTLWIQPDTKICRVTCEGGKEFIIRGTIRGALLEVNERLVENPKLLQSAPSSNGYVAIMRPKPEELRDIQDSLTPIEEYRRLRNVDPESPIFRS